jgi:carbohydrate diacid regulator
VKGIPFLDETLLEETAGSLAANIETEVMCRVHIGCSRFREDDTEYQKLYGQAALALEAGKRFYHNRNVFSYDKLGIAKIVWQIPQKAGAEFLEEVLGDQAQELLNEENYTLIHCFFDNNLNISETARQLYLHRNTLVYRLERIQKITGLDIRRFEDAITMKIALMLLENRE